jgi:hypothetical protein
MDEDARALGITEEEFAILGPARKRIDEAYETFTDEEKVAFEALSELIENLDGSLTRVLEVLLESSRSVDQTADLAITKKYGDEAVEEIRRRQGRA